jgi:hypothetical protein
MRGTKPTFAYLFSTLVMLLLTEISFGGQAFAQMKEYKDQFGRFSIQVPQDWKIDPPTIKKDSIGISFDSNNKDPVTITMVAADRHTKASQSVFEQVIREQNTDTVTRLPGATLVQGTDCTKYTIDGHKACSVVYTVTRGQYTEKDMDIDFETEKQGFSLTVSGSPDSFDKYIPIVEKMLYSLKAP